MAQNTYYVVGATKHTNNTGELTAMHVIGSAERYSERPDTRRTRDRNAPLGLAVCHKHDHGKMDAAETGE